MINKDIFHIGPQKQSEQENIYLHPHLAFKKNLGLKIEPELKYRILKLEILFSWVVTTNVKVIPH